MPAVSKRKAALKKATAIARHKQMLRRKGIHIPKANRDYKVKIDSSEENAYNFNVEVKQEVIDEQEEIDNAVFPSSLSTATPKVFPSTSKTTSSWISQQKQSRPEKKPVPVSSAPPTHCLLCYKLMTDETLQPVLTNNVAEANFNAMFIMKKMLRFPKTRLGEYLESCGNPNNWILFCRECLALVDQSLRIEKEINQLEITLRKCQAEMVNKIGSSWSAKTEKPVLSMPSTITNEIRSFVYNCDASCPTSPFPLHAPVTFTSTSDLSWENERADDQGDEMEEETKYPTTTTAIKPRLCRVPKVQSERQLTSRKKRPPNSKLIYLEDAYRERKFCCPLCPTVELWSLDMLISHAVFHKKRPLKCSGCSLYYSNVEELDKHPVPTSVANESSDDTPRHICSKETLEKAPALQPCELWKCDWCPSLFDLEEDRNLHEEDCTKWKLIADDKPKIELKYKCATCSKQYRSISERWIHRTFVHPEVSEQICLYCDEVFVIQTKEGIDIPSLDALKNHVITQHRLRKSVKHTFDACDFCGSTFSTSLALSSHMEDVHGMPKTSAFSCDICQYRNNVKAKIRNHVFRVHAVDKSLKRHKSSKMSMVCDICGFQWKQCRVTELVNHKLIKHGIEPTCPDTKVYSCDKQDCGGFRCVIERFLAFHMMKCHGAERKHKCKDCGKGFICSKKLREHEEIHKNANIKPYQCEICGNSFAVKNYLYIHMRLSHQNRPFASTNKKKTKPNKSNRRKEVCTNVGVTSLPTSAYSSGSGAVVTGVTTNVSDDNYISEITTNYTVM